MHDYKCSSCGDAAYYDGRCGDGPILMCGCDRRGSEWVDEGSRGGYWTNPTGAKATPGGAPPSSGYSSSYTDPAPKRKKAKRKKANVKEDNPLAESLWFAFGLFANAVSDYHRDRDTPASDPIWSIIVKMGNERLKAANLRPEEFIEEIQDLKKDTL